MDTENRAQVTRAATIVMAAILVSRILGFVRERAIAEVFGRTAATDAFLQPLPCRTSCTNCWWVEP